MRNRRGGRRPALKAQDSGRLVLLPSYNSGPLLARTVGQALEQWPTVWAVVDGSTDDSAAALEAMTAEHPGLRVISLARNQGKGGAVLHAMGIALDAGFSHVLVMDADGQHPPDRIPEFMECSILHPEAMILGLPQFGDDAPLERVYGRHVGNFFAWVETGGTVRDSLFGFRLYPIAPSLQAMNTTRHGRRYDFDTELAVRLVWAGTHAIQRPVPVFYPPTTQGGISHFAYWRDNLLLAKTHARLCLLGIARLLGLRIL